MDSTLVWRTADTLTLNTDSIPNPNSPGSYLKSFHLVQVAIDGGFLHIDPRPSGQAHAWPDGTEYDIYVVPASAVGTLTYKEVAKRKNRGAAF